VVVREDDGDRALVHRADRSDSHGSGRESRGA
jgi:hypothetical protein